eukprot:Gregarina_sp_Poly_1__3410@NODE_198_length_11566_cov_244_091399_g177_i0_p4_GENE_NODE_198_length_11566_cov_244_091399_g177_i0NODE_198_length_11566_cov_244_091399_g177_i0_p4_ORF_typecomplete_len485_score91_66_NODE_198_length_11566_cov_244_091399_g177_i028374291
MFRCCQTPLQHGNELTFETAQFPNEGGTSALLVPNRSNRHWRQLAAGHMSPESPDNLSLVPVGSVSTATPTPRRSRTKKLPGSHRWLTEDSSPASRSPDDDGKETAAPPRAVAFSPPAAALPRVETPPAVLITEPSPRHLPYDAPAELPPPPESAVALSDITEEMNSTPIDSPRVDETQSPVHLPPLTTEAASKPLSPAASPQGLPTILPTSLQRPASPSPKPFSQNGRGQVLPRPNGQQPLSPVANNPFKARENSPPASKPKHPAVRAPPPSARAAGAPGGLRTKDRSKMVDLLDDKAKKDVYIACNFVRETILVDPADNPEVCEREAAFVLWILLFASQLEAEGKQHPVATACAHVMDLAQGELATNSAKKAAPVVNFFTKAIARPVLEQLVSPKTQDVLYVAKDIRDTARVTLGERPPGLQQRTPYLEDLLTGCNYDSLRQMSSSERQHVFRILIDGMEDSRRGGDKYKSAVKAVKDQIFI